MSLTSCSQSTARAPKEGKARLRGLLRGVAAPLEIASRSEDLAVVTAIPGLAGAVGWGQGGRSPHVWRGASLTPDDGSGFISAHSDHRPARVARFN